ncbi:hypothetical protein RBH94_05370 [Aestuariibaculum sp. YM273]|uniref:hypothetical protein n=1 Tax=Aestuariibaculum sp. YM273 TaxID=3070659 RepID=UPI0027DCEFF2|nr:hypothetical protein [Aestuariibaculum sp. YM273]WMI66591.1 hypothetical protein RBH94_05370 [Aestuariibaculum sp. YM273]
MKELNFEITPSIAEILNAELNLGNSIVEINKGWPEKDSVLIILEKPFHKNYKIPDLIFLSINDPHYWKEEYTHKIAKQSIACRF